MKSVAIDALLVEVERQGVDLRGFGHGLVKDGVEAPVVIDLRKRGHGFADDMNGDGIVKRREGCGVVERVEDSGSDLLVAFELWAWVDDAVADGIDGRNGRRVHGGEDRGDCCLDRIRLNGSAVDEIFSVCVMKLELRGACADACDLALEQGGGFAIGDGKDRELDRRRSAVDYEYVHADRPAHGDFVLLPYTR